MQTITVTRIDSDGNYVKEEFVADPSVGEFLATETNSGELTITKKTMNPAAPSTVRHQHGHLAGMFNDDGGEYTLFATEWTRIFPHYYEVEFVDDAPEWQFKTLNEIRSIVAVSRAEAKTAARNAAKEPARPVEDAEGLDTYGGPEVIRGELF